MKDLGYYNGRFGLLDEMTVPMNDRACYFGDGVYDVTFVRNHKPYMLDVHLDRFYNSAKMLNIVIPHTKEELAGIICDMINKVDDGEQNLYIQVTRGSTQRSHDYPEPFLPGNMWMMIRPMSVRDTYQKIKLITRPDTRFFHCNIKTINLIPAVMYTHEATMAGCNEAVLHRDGRVTECAHSNVSILKDGVFRTAPLDNLILPGVARRNLLRFCRELGIPTDETPFYLDDLRNADEIIVSSSSAFCLSACELDGVPCGGKAPELLKKLQDTAMYDFISKTE